MRIEIELEEKKRLPSDGSRCIHGRVTATLVVIGKIQNAYGSEYPICEDDECLDLAYENENYCLTNKDR